MTTAQGAALHPGVWRSGRIVGPGGVGIRYQRLTEAAASAPKLVAVHGITDSGSCWSRAARRLAREFDVILVDARGHGESDKPATGYSYQHHALDLRELITQLELERPVLLGHSMGAHIVATLAATAPDLAGAIVLEDPPWTDQREATSNPYTAVIEYFADMPLDEVIAEGADLNEHWNREDVEQWARAKLQVSRHAAAELVTGDWRFLLREITCPGLLITGEPGRGALISAEVEACVKAANSNFEIARISGAGHNIHRDRLDQFLAAVAVFTASATVTKFDG